MYRQHIDNYIACQKSQRSVSCNMVKSDLSWSRVFRRRHLGRRVTAVTRLRWPIVTLMQGSGYRIFDRTYPGLAPLIFITVPTKMPLQYMYYKLALPIEQHHQTYIFALLTEERFAWYLFDFSLYDIKFCTTRTPIRDSHMPQSHPTTAPYDYWHPYDFLPVRPSEAPVGVLRRCCSRGHIRLRAPYGLTRLYTYGLIE